MDKIYINQMEFYGYHGVLPEETKLGQKFIVDLTIELDLNEAGLTDNLVNTVNYAEVYQIVKGILEGPPFKLIEAIAERVAEKVLGQFSVVDRCTVKVIKPNPPIVGHYHSVAVEINRGKND
ncbi:dihydroneopterin aldolase [Anaerobacillus alkalilacustris]|uniref:7,8-dihydroneopterin aldolase n=1 Tax=Anaerobacillus alkalilacustris TaxID=393763 RepID=A0A1S2LZ79_9BACI|nr:dihydroneopterin aldolase [Anaerobacillus alkalilacustris]OIJ17523.1 dihydroneopterin aldolase [Anaerobacillus alkalilacustris]